LDRRLGGPQSRSGRGGEEKNSQIHVRENLIFPFYISIINIQLVSYFSIPDMSTTRIALLLVYWCV
jgi:hypothetical protein